MGNVKPGCCALSLTWLWWVRTPRHAEPAAGGTDFPLAPDQLPCWICQRPAIMRDEHGQAVHKVCLEARAAR